MSLQPVETVLLSFATLVQVAGAVGLYHTLPHWVDAPHTSEEHPDAYLIGRSLGYIGGMLLVGLLTVSALMTGLVAFES